MQGTVDAERVARIRSWAVGGVLIWALGFGPACAVGFRPTSSPEVFEARYEIRFRERLVGEEFVRRVEGDGFVCIEGRVRQTAPETMDLSYDVLEVGGRIESLAVDFELEGVEIGHEAWRRGEQLVGTTRRFGRKEQRTGPVPPYADLGSPLSWLTRTIPEGELQVWSVRPPDLGVRRVKILAGPPASPRHFEAGPAAIEAGWPKDGPWPERVVVSRPRWGADRLVRARRDVLLNSSPFAPRLRGRCPTSNRP